MGVLQSKLLFLVLNTLKKRFKCQLINLIIGEAKMAIYVSRRNRIESNSGDSVLLFFVILFKSRILIDLKFHQEMKDLVSFENTWCLEGA